MNHSFVADAMLGSLAKWLRILGYDTVYDPDLDDHQLVRLARAEDRIILTRDLELARRRGVRVLWLGGEQLDEQLLQVMTDLNLEFGHAFSRCPVCNERLEPMDREAARAWVPAYIAQAHERFSFCSTCQQVYWRGTHWQQMKDHLARLRLNVARSESDKASKTDST